MESEKDYFIDDLEERTDELLEELSGIDDFIKKKASKANELIERETSIRELSVLEKETAHETDGNFELHLADDELSVIANFFPPLGMGKNIYVDDVIEGLRELGVNYGIDKVSIEQAVNKCNEERIHVNDVVVARGVKPIDEIPEHFVLEKVTEKTPIQVKGDVQHIDFREITSYTLVKKGEVLAKIVPSKEGEFGKTVKGLFIPYNKAKSSKPKPMKNTAIDSDRIIAICDGRLMIDNNLFWVNEVFELQGDVDYNTGNISFPGDIIIHGQVKDGFKVDAGGSIVCNGTLDASEIICKKDLTIEKGIIGRKTGRVNVGGRIVTKFIENCYVEARDSVYVETGILHSIVNTQNLLQMGMKSVIVGGKIYSQNGVIAAHVGSRIGAKTEIYCGIDHETEKKLSWVKNKANEIGAKLVIVEQRLSRNSSGSQKLMEVRDKLKIAINKLNLATKELLQKQQKNEKAEVVIKGKIYPGVYIELCHAPFIVSREMDSVKFLYDRENRKVMMYII